MIQAIIVDDEEQVRYGLGRFFDFTKYGVIVSDYAANGVEALALIRQKRHQLVITDVRMPVMDGIALCRQLHEEFHDEIQTLFVSAYNELDYIHSAIKLGAADYLTKPVDEDEFNEVMLRVSERIRRKQKLRQEEENYRTQLSESYYAVLERYYAGLWLGVANQLPPPMLALPDQGTYTPLLLQLNPDDSRSLSPLRDICTRLIDEDTASCAMESALGEICLIRYTALAEAAEDAYTLAAKIRQATSEALCCAVSIGIGQPSPLPDLSQSCVSLRGFMERQLFSRNGQIVVYMPPSPSNIRPFTLDAGDFTLLTAALENQDESKMGMMLCDLFNRMRIHPNVSRESCHIAALQLLTHAVSHLGTQGVSTVHENMDVSILSRRLRGFYAIDDLQVFVSQVLSQYLNMLAAWQTEHSDNTVNHIKKVIHMRFSQALTVQEIAQQVFLSVPYACTLFKQETGETINEYLTRYRMKKACELLMDRRYKLYQIGAAVGYADAAYFTRIFRKYIGQSPNAYRKSRRIDA